MIAILRVSRATVGWGWRVGSATSGVSIGMDPVAEGGGISSHGVIITVAWVGWTGVGIAEGEGGHGVAIGIVPTTGIGKVGFHPAKVANLARPVGIAVAGVN